MYQRRLSYVNINLDEIAEQTIGFTGADLLQLLNESLLRVALEGRDFITQQDLLNARNSVKPSALREFHLERPKDRSNEIKDENIMNRIKQIADDFSINPCFKPILLPKSLSLADKMASTIASIVHRRLHCPYLVVRTTWFRTRWFGEMERSIRELFGKIKRSQPCVVYLKNIDAIAKSGDEHLHGAILELLGHLMEFKDNNVKVLLLCSATYEIDPQIKTFYEEAM
ncbi:MAG: AAA family ATPase [Thermoproteota archaeon]